MAIAPIPYSQFISQDFILSKSGGPWHCSGFANRSCLVQNAWFTSNQSSISSFVKAEDPLVSYKMLLRASILVDLTSIGNQFSYNWSFLATSLSDQASGRREQLFKSSLGNTTYEDFIPIQNVSNIETWTNASYVYHTGDIILEGNDTNRILELSLEATLSRLPSESVDLSVRNLHLVLEPSIHISSGVATSVVPRDLLGSSIHTSSGVAAAATPSDVDASVPLPDPSTLQIAISSPAAGTIPWIIGCSVACCTLLILLTILAVLLWKRRKRLRRISLSKVKSIKRPDPLLTDDLPAEVTDITGQHCGVITPFHSNLVSHSISQSKAPRTSRRREHRRRERHLNPPPPYPKGPSLPLVTEEPVDAIPIRLTPQQRRSNLHNSPVNAIPIRLMPQQRRSNLHDSVL